jgi:hypothetical protein
MTDKTELIPKITIVQMVEAYGKACSLIDQAFEQLHEAQSRINAAFGESCSLTCYPSDIYHNHYRRNRDDLKSKLLRGAWMSIIVRLDLHRLTTEKREKEIMARIEKNPPPLTVEDVTNTLLAVMQNLDSITGEFLEDVYRKLRPNYSWSPYKTNNTPGIGRKVILVDRVQMNFSGRGYRVNYYHANDLNRICRAFYFLDGSPYKHDAYRSELVDAIQSSQAGEGETRYFRFKCFTNGNLHLSFKRMDLVDKLNAMFGGMTLKPGKTPGQTTFV